MLHWRWHL